MASRPALCLARISAIRRKHLGAVYLSLCKVTNKFRPNMSINSNNSDNIMLTMKIHTCELLSVINLNRAL